jgi:hypothetical protein
VLFFGRWALQWYCVSFLIFSSYLYFFIILFSFPLHFSFYYFCHVPLDIIVALAGYLDFLSVLLTPLGGNILNLYLQSDVVIDVGRAGLLGTIVMSFPLLTHPARDLFNELILSKTCWYRDTICRHVLVTIFIVGMSLVVACVTPNIVVVWSVLGSTVAILIAFVFPPLMYLKTLEISSTLDAQQTTLLIATPMPTLRRNRSYTEDELEIQEEVRSNNYKNFFF